jgi:hypothetical protein
MTVAEQIQKLNQNNFEEFLKENLKKIFVFETEDFEYYYYFPTYLMISKSSKAEGKFMRQC